MWRFGSLSERGSEKARRFQGLYRSLLTPVGLIVTVSGVFYVNYGSFLNKESFLISYQLLVGGAVLLLLASVFLYAHAYIDSEKYHRRLSWWAFFCMMSAAFWSSTLLVVPIFSQLIPGENREPVVLVGFVLYMIIGLVFTVRFCQSKL
jgi:hypothetical protein